MTVAALHQALANPGMYPEPTTRVEVRETHISLVYLTDQYAYKIKKPVNFGFVDYSTLAQRQAFCRQEVLLNRRVPRLFRVFIGIQDRAERRGGGMTGEAGEFVIYRR